MLLSIARDDSQPTSKSNTTSKSKSKTTSKATESTKQLAARWANNALDPRNSLKLLGRTGTALLALALRPPVASAAEAESSSFHYAAGWGSTCSGYEDVRNPGSGGAYGLYAACEGVQSYIDRFTKACGAQVADLGNPQSWTQLHNWNSVGAALYRQSDAVAANDTAFEACLLKEAGAEAKQADTDGWIVLGVVFGSFIVLPLLMCGTAMGATYCCRLAKRARNRARVGPRDEEAGPTPSPDRAPSPHLPPTLQALPAESMSREMGLLTSPRRTWYPTTA